MKAWISAALVLVTTSASALEVTRVPHCAVKDPLTCETVQGRLFYSSMTNRYLRLSARGSDRLRVVRSFSNSLGETLDKIQGLELGVQARGTYTVCPLEKLKPKKAQAVCLAEAKDFRVVER